MLIMVYLRQSKSPFALTDAEKLKLNLRSFGFFLLGFEDFFHSRKSPWELNCLHPNVRCQNSTWHRHSNTQRHRQEDRGTVQPQNCFIGHKMYWVHLHMGISRRGGGGAGDRGTGHRHIDIGTLHIYIYIIIYSCTMQHKNTVQWTIVKRLPQTEAVIADREAWLVHAF